ncbi:MAG TPA: hypothetical protein VFV41_28365 [Streptosporangiaceae bacterium]|nr:hypothetical protein [Streptosporangiaceae bacterium]
MRKFLAVSLVGIPMLNPGVLHVAALAVPAGGTLAQAGPEVSCDQ